MRKPASWIHIVDLDGARSGKPENAEVIKRIVAATSLKTEVGGGVRSMETLDSWIEAGASRVVLGTALVRNPEFAKAAIEKYGDRLSAGIDAKNGEVAIAGWREGSGVDARELAAHVGSLGYRHLVYTDIARDGMQTGIDEQMYVEVARAFGHPVIASGGVANMDDIVRLSQVSDSIEGVIAGRAVYEGTLDVSAACAMMTL